MAQKFENLENQNLYATVLEWITHLGLVILLGTFLLYMLGVFKSLIPLEELPQYWNLPLQEFLRQTGAPIGWGWLECLGKGDYLNFIGLALFAGATGICYLVLFFDFIKKGNKLYTYLVGAELLLVFLAASNLLKVGH